MRPNSIKTETQWGNNIIINVNVIIKDQDSLPEGFVQKIKRQLFTAIFSSATGAEQWDEYEKNAMMDGSCVVGKLPEKTFER